MRIEGNKTMKKLKLSAIIAVIWALFSSCAWPGISFAALSGSGGSGGGGGLFFLPGGGSAKITGIEITLSSSTIAAGTAGSASVTAIYSDGSNQDITSNSSFSSSDETVATVNSSGSISGLVKGSAKISASYESFSDSANLTVSDAKLVSLSIDPVNSIIANGFDKQFFAAGIFTDNSVQDLTDQVTWETGDGAVATIDITGLLSSVGTGTTSVTASMSGVSDTTNIEISGATLLSLTINPQETTVANGYDKQFTVTGIFSNSTTQDLTDQVTWSSSDTGVATISNGSGTEGYAESAGTGTTTITATHVGSGKADMASMTVSSATLESIVVTPDNPIAYGTNQQFTATGYFSDNTTQDLTDQVTWNSSDTGVATVSNAASYEGLATSVSSGTTTISATLSGKTGDSLLEVKLITLQSISIVPADPTLYHGSLPDTQNFHASGTYSDATVQDLTDQVLWSSSDTSVATVSNSSPNKGLLTTAGAGSMTLSATRNGVTGTTSVTVTTDTTAPTISSVTSYANTDPVCNGVDDCILVNFSEAVNVSEATNAANYIVADSMSGTCAGGDNFSSSSQTADFGISSVTAISQSSYALNIDSGTSAKTYTLIADLDIHDLAATPNAMGCPNNLNFQGQDRVPPYLLTANNTTSTTIIVTFSEDMLTTGGGTDDASVASNYTLTENDTTTNNDSCTDRSVLSATKIDEKTIKLTLDGDVCAIKYKITAASTLTDLAGNALTDPKYLTFTGNEAIKVVSAEASDVNTVEITFSKPVLPSSAECSTISGCAVLYQFNDTSLGDITGATVGSGDRSNVVTLVHSVEQLGISYTVIVANGEDGDGFNNGSTSIQSTDLENVQSAPKDRASFVGAGDAITTFDDGSYFVDPYVDGTSFSWAFTYGGRVYLGTNDKNNSAFRFDPNGGNSVQVGFAFSSGSCPDTDTFGYYTDGSYTCGVNSGPNGEQGVVGFNSVTLTGTYTDHEALLVGPVDASGVTKGYYTTDLDTTLDWTEVGFSVTGGANTESIQTLYGSDSSIYLGFSSDHGQQAPIIARHVVSFTGTGAADEVISSVASGTDMSARSVPYIGKNAGGSSNAGNIVGIDSILMFNGELHVANNGGIASSPDQATFDTTNAYAWSSIGATGTTLELNSLQKLRPGEKGAPYMIEHAGRLYLARNVANTSVSNTTPDHGELWVCDDIDADGCESGEWTLIVDGSAMTDLPYSSGTISNTISLLIENGGYLYIGFDDPDTGLGGGVRVFRYDTPDAHPSVASGSLSASGWTQQSTNGFGSDANTHIFSGASITDLANNNFVYVVTGNASNPIKVYRQID